MSNLRIAQKIRIKTLCRNIFIDVDNIKALVPNEMNSKLTNLFLKDNDKPYVLNKQSAYMVQRLLESKRGIQRGYVTS